MDDLDWEEIRARIREHKKEERERELREEQRRHEALAKAIADEFEKRGFVPYERKETKCL